MPFIVPVHYYTSDTTLPSYYVRIQLYNNIHTVKYYYDSEPRRAAVRNYRRTISASKQLVNLRASKTNLNPLIGYNGHRAHSLDLPIFKNKLFPFVAKN